MLLMLMSLAHWAFYNADACAHVHAYVAQVLVLACAFPHVISKDRALSMKMLYVPK